MALFGPPNIEKLKAKGKVEGLVKALGSEDWKVRQAAVKALGEIGDPWAVEPLALKLKDSDSHVRQAAVEALVEIGESSTPVLLICLENDLRLLYEWQDARRMLDTLDEQSKKNLEKLLNENLEKLLSVVKDSDELPTDTKVAILALAQLKKEAPISRNRVNSVVVSLGDLRDPSAVLHLAEAMKYEDKDVRKAAAEALGKIGAPAVQPLTEALGDKERDVCIAAAEALDNLGWEPDREEVGARYWIIKQNNWDKCVSIGAPAVEPLIKALGDKDKSVRRNAAGALGGIGDPRAIEPLIKALGEKDSDVRGAAAEALGKIGDPRAFERLVEVLKDRDKYVRRNAAEALEMMGWEPDRGEVGARYWISKENWDKCVSIGAPAVEPLITVLGDWDKNVRETAAVALGMIGAPAVEPLIKALGDKNENVRYQAALALAEIGDARAVAPLIGVLGYRDKDVRKAAAETLLRIYRKGDLGQEQKQLVLRCKPQITEKHNDNDSCGVHGDSGIGIAFDI